MPGLATYTERLQSLGPAESNATQADSAKRTTIERPRRAAPHASPALGRPVAAVACAWLRGARPVGFRRLLPLRGWHPVRVQPRAGARDGGCAPCLGELFRGVARRVHRHGHAGVRQAWRPHELLGPRRVLGLRREQAGGPVVQDLARGQAAGHRVGVRLGEHGQGGRRGEEGALPGVGGAGILAVRPLGRVAQAAPARLPVGGRRLQAAAGGVPQEALAVGDESAPRFGPAL